MKEERRDKNGLTEAEFLAQYDPDVFEHPSVTVDMILLQNEKVLLIRRGGHPALGKLAVPGGFVEPHETVQEAAARELMEETGVTNIALKELPVRSQPDRDPRCRIITVPFLVHTDSPEKFAAGDDADDAAWWDYSVKDENELVHFTLTHGDNVETFTVRRVFPQTAFPADIGYEVVGENNLAGDHATLIACAWDTLERNW